MTPPLKPGERVAFYNWGERHVGTVVSIDDDHIEVNTGICQHGVHRKQCRRLKKRKRREWWIARSPRTGEWKVFDYNPQNADEPSPEVVKVREVKPTPAPGGEK